MAVKQRIGLDGAAFQLTTATERASPISTLSTPHSKLSSSESLGSQDLGATGHAMHEPYSTAGSIAQGMPAAACAAPAAPNTTRGMGQSGTVSVVSQTLGTPMMPQELAGSPGMGTSYEARVATQAAAVQLDAHAQPNPSCAAMQSTRPHHRRSSSGGATCGHSCGTVLCDAGPRRQGANLQHEDPPLQDPHSQHLAQPRSDTTTTTIAAAAAAAAKLQPGAPLLHTSHHTAPAAPVAGAGAPPPKHSGPIMRPGHLGRTHYRPSHSGLNRAGSSGSSSSSGAAREAPLPLPRPLPRRSATVAPISGDTASASSSAPPASRSLLDPGPCLASSSSDECDEATRRITAAFPRLHTPAHERHRSWSVLGGGSLEPISPRLLRSERTSNDGTAALSPEEAEALEKRRQNRGNYHLTGQAAVELFLRVNHARQTLDFTKRQATLFASLDRAVMDVWEALDLMNELREYQAALVAGSAHVDPDLPLKEHAFQTAELCRMAHPEHDWLHLVGLIHGLGKLLAHRIFGSQPQWATCGESFPLGCRFDPSIQGTQFFSANPDRRRRAYNSPLGIYSQGCGLHSVYMSWSAAEYLYLMLLLNETRLPQQALFVIRYQKFSSLTCGSGAYRPLLSPSDEAMLPLLASFQQLSAYRRVVLPPDKVLPPQQFRSYYQGLMDKYFGKGRKLAW